MEPVLQLRLPLPPVILSLRKRLNFSFGESGVGCHSFVFPSFLLPHWLVDWIKLHGFSHQVKSVSRFTIDVGNVMVQGGNWQLLVTLLNLICEVRRCAQAINLIGKFLLEWNTLRLSMLSLFVPLSPRIWDDYGMVRVGWCRTGLCWTCHSSSVAGYRLLINSFIAKVRLNGSKLLVWADLAEIGIWSCVQSNH